LIEKVGNERSDTDDLIQQKSKIGNGKNMELEELAEPEWLEDDETPLIDITEDPRWVDVYEV
jgi:hypothetical protein